jgi:hypothetical protein
VSAVDDLAMLNRRIDCPIDWCGGRWFEHGGEGDDPDTWLHEEEPGIELPHGASLRRSQVGSGPVMWSLAIPFDEDQYGIRSFGDRATAARWLRDMADAAFLLG